MSQITTHVLDTTRGLPAQNLPIALFRQSSDGWTRIAHGVTNKDGRIEGLLSNDLILPSGIYRMNFETQTYFNANNEKGFYPYVDIVFELDNTGQHYHIPLLLTAYGYSTYRGS